MKQRKNPVKEDGETILSEIIETTDIASTDTANKKEGGPQGIGMAVAFDWGLAVQMFATPILPVLFGKPFSPVSLVTIPLGVAIAAFGESIRSGWRPARMVQVIFNALGFVGGIASLFNVWQSSKQGNYWPIVTTVILLVFSPLIAWRLNSARSKEWFATTTSTAARKRHGGAWPFLIALWAIVGGVLQALAAFNR